MRLPTTIPTILAAGLAAFDAGAAPAPDRPLRVLYLGPIQADGGGLGGGSRTNYVDLPGQTLPPEAIYFDHLADPGQIPEPVRYQAPLSPWDSMRYTQIPADFVLRLFASEPDVVKPIRPEDKVRASAT